LPKTSPHTYTIDLASCKQSADQNLVHAYDVGFTYRHQQNLARISNITGMWIFPTLIFVDDKLVTQSNSLLGAHRREIDNVVDFTLSVFVFRLFHLNKQQPTYDP
jgi:hypothetical protein